MATIVFLLPDPGFLVGRGHLELYVDHELCGTSTYENETLTIDITPGRHVVSAELVAAFRRRSRPITIDVPENGRIAVYANYSRLWGNVRLSTTHRPPG